MVNYSNGKVYKLINDVDDEIYIGSTCQSLAKRKGEHKVTARSKPNQKVYRHLNAIGWEHVKIILIESVNAFNREQLRQRGQHYIDLWKPSLNSANRYVYKTPPKKKCIHKKFKNCKVCYSYSICEHEEVRRQCKPCRGLCEHSEKVNSCWHCIVLCECGFTHRRSNTSHHNKSKNHKLYEFIHS